MFDAQNGGEQPSVSKKRGKKKKGDGVQEIEQGHSTKDILRLLVRLHLAAAACRFTTEVRIGQFMSAGLGSADY
jgi:hypothetical protein